MNIPKSIYLLGLAAVVASSELGPDWGRVVFYSYVLCCRGSLLAQVRVLSALSFFFVLGWFTFY